jgi:DNA-binding GntR family transcriptional regulator
MVATGNAEHAMILEAVEAREGARAARIVTDHLEAAAKLVQQTMNHDGTAPDPA